MDLYKSTAHELHDKLINKEISSVELTKALYERIDAVEDQVKAYVTLDKENALAQAAKVDAMIAAGEKIAPLAGIPGAIKDNICTKGLLTTCSSKILEPGPRTRRLLRRQCRCYRGRRSYLDSGFRYRRFHSSACFF